jgi:hypothetical protein
MYNTCLLCRERKVYHIKSHLTPAGITENTYGERDREHIYKIDAQVKVIDEYFGRNHPQQENTAIKKEPNSRKGIFCKKCEDDLGIYESAVQDKLNETINSIGNGATINSTALGVKYVNIDIHPNILTTFFKSVIWRQCLEQTLDNKDNPLNAEQFENLRALVVENISIPIKEMTKKEIMQSPKISIFTSYKTKLAASYANPHPKYTNPLLFFIGPVLLQYWLSNIPSAKFEEITRIDKIMLDEHLTLDKSRIGVVNESKWKKIHYVVAQILAGQYLRR